MKTASSIYINFRDTLDKAARLEELADRLTKTAELAESEVQAQIQSSWTGKAADKGLRKNWQLAARMKAHAAQLRLASWGLRQAAWNQYQIEMTGLGLLGK